MDRPILFWDSGIGGLPYYGYFHKRNLKEVVVYVADRANFPYGTKTKDELIRLLLELSSRLIACFSPKLAVMACNTASVSALPVLREAFPDLLWVGTVPAIKPAVIESASRCIGVLGTDRTIEDPYIAELASQYGADAGIIGIAAPDLVEFVEHKYADATEREKQEAVLPYIKQFRNAGVDAVVLGCTHFLLLLDMFRKAAAPDIRIYDSIKGVSYRVETLLDEHSLRAKNWGKTENLLVLTGSFLAESIWRQRATTFGLRLCLLNTCAEAYP
jgi:glutamate racemase